MKKSLIKYVLITIFVLLFIISYYSFGLDSYLNFETLKQNQQKLQEFYQNYPFRVILLYSVVYLMVVAFSLPGAAVMTLAGGLIFNLVLGTILVSFISTIGATINFLLSRYLFRSQLEKRFLSTLDKVNQGLEKDGNFYLFSLRMIPVFPFFLINVIMGLTNMKGLNFFVVSQIGMLPGTIAYVNAGTQLASIQSLSEILTFPVFISFIILGLLPLLAKYFINFIQKTKKGVN